MLSDYSTIIVGLLAFAGTALTSWATVNKVLAVMSEKISNLQREVNKHNQIVERTYKLESDVATAFVRMDEIREDIHDLKKGGSK